MIELKDIVPKQTVLKLSNGKEYKINPITLRDEAYFQQIWNKDEYAKIFTEVRVNDLCRILYRLMDNEHKKDFAPIKQIDYDENGYEIEKSIGGIELLSSFIVGIQDKIAIINCILEAIGISQPMRDQIEDEENKKKIIKSQLIGD